MEPESIIKQALVDRYEIQSVIGKGGMATVYKAIQKSLNRPVALKVVHQNLVHDEEFISRFLHEARVCASLNHPNVVTVYDVGSFGSVHFISMEYLEGMTLRDLINRKKSLSADETVKYIVPVADVLGFMHRQGIIHRDVKSSNIFITKSGRAVLMDFGIVLSEGRDYLTHDGSILGTPEYMSPEQAGGKIKIDGRSDIYSLGVVLFECLTGVLPFRSDNYMTTLQHVLNDSPPSITSINAQIPKWISSIVTGCLVKERSLRIPDGSTLAKALRNKEKVKLSNTTSDHRTRKITTEDIKVLEQKENKNQASKNAEKNRNTILITLIISIVILLLILGLFTIGPLQKTSSAGTGIPNLRTNNTSMNTRSSDLSTQTIQPHVIEITTDPHAEIRIAVTRELALGDRFLTQGSYDSAISRYTAALHLNPRDTIVQQKIKASNIRYLQYIINQGDTFLQSSDYRKALTSYEKANKMYPTNSDAKQKIINCKSKWTVSLLAIGDNCVSNRNFQQALDTFNYALKIDPNNPNAKQKISTTNNQWCKSLIKMGDNYLYNKNYDLAIQTYKHAKQIDQSNSTIDTKILNAEEKKNKTETIKQVEEILQKMGINMIKVESSDLGSYYIGESEVTQRLWKEIMGSNPSSFIGDQLPVESVSYNEVLKFINKLNQKINTMTLMLPTKEEWEFAAKGGNKSQNFNYSGSEKLSEVGWYFDNSNGSTHNVMSLRKNELGIYDMSGNVMEWCRTIIGDNMVIKGGSWLSPNNSCTTSWEKSMSPNQGNSEVGFRLYMKE